MCCSQADSEAFTTLIEHCRRLDIPIEKYLSCAFSYIKKYSTPGHRLGIPYFLNEKVVSYCGANLENFNSSSLLLEQIKNDILYTEKSIRNMMVDTSKAYDACFGTLLKAGKVSSFFLAYKKLTGSLLVSSYSSEYFDKLVGILEPFFTYILAKNNVYNTNKIQEWNNSKIEDFGFCSVYFTDRYITNELVEESLGNDATTQGTTLHGIFETIFKRYNKSKTKNLKAIAMRYFESAAYLAATEQLQDHTPFIEKLFKEDTSLFYSLIQKDTKVLIEHKMSAVLEGIMFYGTADLILINGTTAYVLDYKSSKLDPKYLPKNNAKYHKQLSLYAKLLRQEMPELTEVSGTVIYTRGLIHHFDDMNNNIHIERALDIQAIKKTLDSGILVPNTNSCFLCRHPACKFRTRESIWDSTGSRRNK